MNFKSETYNRWLIFLGTVYVLTVLKIRFCGIMTLRNGGLKREITLNDRSYVTFGVQNKFTFSQEIRFKYQD